jgi:hypothetical protein
VTTSRTLGWGPTEIDGINVLQRNGLFDAGTPVQPDLDRRFTKLVGFWAPRRWLTTETRKPRTAVACASFAATRESASAYWLLGIGLSSWTSSYRCKPGHAPCDCPTSQERREHPARVGLPRRSSPEAPS